MWWLGWLWFVVICTLILWLAAEYRWLRRDINILYKRTDKRTRGFEIERQVRVSVSRELRKLRDRVRVLEQDMKYWRRAMRSKKLVNFLYELEEPKD